MKKNNRTLSLTKNTVRVLGADAMNKAAGAGTFFCTLGSLKCQTNVSRCISDRECPPTY